MQKEDIGWLGLAERADDRAKDPTLNACGLLRGTVLAALSTKDEFGRPHMIDDTLPTLTKIAWRTANDAWHPSLDDDPLVSAILSDPFDLTLLAGDLSGIGKSPLAD